MGVSSDGHGENQGNTEEDEDDADADMDVNNRNRGLTNDKATIETAQENFPLTIDDFLLGGGVSPRP